MEHLFIFLHDDVYQSLLIKAKNPEEALQKLEDYLKKTPTLPNEDWGYNILGTLDKDIWSN